MATDKGKLRTGKITIDLSEIKSIERFEHPDEEPTGRLQTYRGGSYFMSSREFADWVEAWAEYLSSTTAGE